MNKTMDGAKKPKRKKFIILGITAVFIVIFCIWQNNMLTVSQYTYENPKIGAESDGFTIVQLSDLHNKSFGKGQKRLLDKVKELSPDTIVITGDIVDANHTNIEKAVDLAKGAAEIAPTYYITGNHESWLDSEKYAELMDGLTAAGVTMMDNADIALNASLHLYGISDETLTTYPDGHLPPKNGDTLNILLAHEPQYIEDYAASSADLVLTGHAHGGQFRLPFIGGIVAPDQGLFPKYTEGVHRRGDMAMAISRGLGNSVIPVRVFNFPEIVAVTLVRSF